MNPSSRVGVRVGLVFALVLLYGLSINPYPIPNQYDNLVYYHGAQSLAEGGSYEFEGQRIVRWPPGTSLLLAIPFSFGWQSMWAAKAVILLCVASGLLGAYSLFRREKREAAALTVVLFALLPQSLLMGSRIMSEWPFIAISFLFLLLLHRLRRIRSGRSALLAGVVLGMAGLTRWTGMLLEAAVLAQALGVTRGASLRSRLHGARPEIIVAIVGAAIWIGWIAGLPEAPWRGGSEVVTGSVDNLARIPAPPPLPVGLRPVLDKLGMPSDLFWSTSAMTKFFGLEDHLGIAFLLALPAVVMLLGMAVRFGSGAARPGDWYALLTVTLFAGIEWRDSRYLLPVAPFLIFYLFTGSGFLLARVAGLRWACAPRTLRSGFLALWIAALTLMNGHLLFYGNASRTHSGLCLAASPRPEDFYIGYWGELYRVCQVVREDPGSGSVTVVGRGKTPKYVSWFAGRRATAPGDPVAFVLTQGEDPKALPFRELGEVLRSEQLILYRVAP